MLPSIFRGNAMHLGSGLGDGNARVGKEFLGVGPAGVNVHEGGGNNAGFERVR